MAGGQFPPQKLSSSQGTKSAGVLKQAPAANIGVGNNTARGSGKQASPGGKKATEATADYDWVGRR